MHIKLFPLALLLSIVLSAASPAHAYTGPATRIGNYVIWVFTKLPHALPDREIARLAKLAQQPGGTKRINQELGKRALPEAVLEDTYLRIAIQNGTLARSEAGSLHAALRGVPGFRSTLSKIIGASPDKKAGHLNELRIAQQARQNGFETRGIGVPFNDPNKAAPTDIDILLSRNGRFIAIEAKDYARTTHIPLDQFRADMVTLVEYAKVHSAQHVIKVFSMTNKPSNPNTVALLEATAKRHGVELIFGSPGQQIHQIRQLERIL